MDEKERRRFLRQILLKQDDLVLLDDPFARLDEPGCAQMKELIREIAQQGRTVVLTGTSLAFIKDLCDRLTVISRGQVEATGTLQELLATRDSLRYIGELLPELSAKRVLQVIRQEVGVSEPPDEFTPRHHDECPGSREPAAGSFRAPVAGQAASAPGPPRESRSGIDHKMLAALTKNSDAHLAAAVRGRSISPPVSEQ